MNEGSLYRHWEPKEYQFTLQAGPGATMDGDDTVTVTYNTPMPLLPRPSREGYDFIGWRLTCEGNSNELQITKGTDYIEGLDTLNDRYFDEMEGELDSPVLEAIWERKSINVYLVFNNPELEQDDLVIEVPYGDALDPRDLPTVDTGICEIVAWSLSPTWIEAPEGSVTDTLTLYAIWRDYTTIHFHVGDMTYDERVYVDQSYERPDPTRDGYHFDGWYSSDNFAGLPLQSPFTYYSPKDLYAKFDLATYTLTFDSTWGTFPPVTYTIESEPLALPEPLRANYEFMGWVPQDDPEATPILTLRTGALFADYTMVPVFLGERKVVELNPDGGNLRSDTATVRYGDDYSLPVPVRGSYAFLGWFSAEGEDAVQMTDENGRSLAPWDSELATTPLYARYTRKYYVTVESAIAGAGTATFADYYVQGQTVRVKAKPSVGYTFAGFYRDGELVCSSQTYEFEMPASDVTLTMSFVSYVAQLTLQVTEAGAHCSHQTASLTFANSFRLPRAFLSGYKFMGWAISRAELLPEESALFLSLTDDAVMVTDAYGYPSSATLTGVSPFIHDVTLVAVFEPDPDNKDIIISTAAEFLQIRENPAGSYVLVGDINLQGIVWEPFVFTGTLEGNGYTVRNLSVSSDGEAVGLFSVLRGTVRGVSLEQVTVRATSPTTSASVGAFCGRLEGTLDDCRVLSGVISYTGNEFGDVGGLVGQFASGTLSSCTNYASVTGKGTSAAGTTGGVVGCATSAGLSLLFNAGEIRGDWSVGGVIGLFSIGGNVSLKTELQNTGRVSGACHVGGVIGSLNNATSARYTNYRLEFSGMTNSGAVSGESQVGGVIGWLYVWNTDNAATTTVIRQLYNTGAVTATQTLVGGVVGSSAIGGYDLLYSQLENTGAITAASYVGGVFGEIYATVRAQYNSYTVSWLQITNSGEVTANGDYVGGIVGVAYCTNSHDGTYAFKLRMLKNTANVTGGQYVGGLVGSVTAESTASLVSESSSCATVAGTSYVGGLIGAAVRVQLTDSSNAGSTVTATGAVLESEVYRAYLGGYVGRAYTVSGCDNAVSLTYTGKGRYVGGIAGYSDGCISSCKNTGTVSATAASYVGGVAGCVGIGGWDVTYSELVNQASVTATDHVGGIFGEITGDVSAQYNSYTLSLNEMSNGAAVTGSGDYVGGLIGFVSVNNPHNGTYVLRLRKLVNTADITGGMWVGGVVGYLSAESADSTMSECSSAAHVTAEAIVGGLVGQAIRVRLQDCSNAGTTFSVTGAYLDSDKVYYAYFGGYAGIGYCFSQCINRVDLTYEGKGSRVGGIVGYATGWIDDCENHGDVSAQNSSYVGGLVGDNRYASWSFTCSKLVNSGSIRGKDCVGGIYGNITATTSDRYNTIVTSYESLTNSGAVYAAGSYAGGIIGYGYCHNSQDGASYYFTYRLLSNTGNIQAGEYYAGGLFGYIQSEGVSSCSEGSSSGTVQAKAIVGGIGGYVPTMDLFECSNAGTQVTASGAWLSNGSYYAYLGGYAGCVRCFNSCQNEASLTYTGNGAFVGGIAGYVNLNFASSSNAGDISAPNAEYVGGLVGACGNGDSANYSDLENTGDVNGKARVGGILGSLDVTVDDRYNTRKLSFLRLTNSGAVTASGEYAGGIAGYMYGHNSHNSSFWFDMRLLSNTGDVSGTGYVGGLIGCFQSEGMSACAEATSTGTVNGASDTGELFGKMTNMTVTE